MLIILQWSAILGGALLAWWPGSRWLSLAALGVGYGLAAVNGTLGPEAALPVLSLAVAAYLMLGARGPWHTAAAHVIVLALAGPLFLHLFPGFSNPLVIGPERLTPDATPYKMYLNLDKPLILFWLLLVCPRQVLAARPLATSLGVGIAACAAATMACLAVALWLGAVTWAPKWPAWGWLWVANNLLLVAPAEEALFRGYIQAGIAHLLAGMSFGGWAAVGIAAALFGLAHVPGGWAYMLLAGMAGIGYGVAYRHGGLLAAVAAHFGLNLIHLALFTYPMLAR